MTWAEAVAREAAGASIRLDQRLWQRAAKEQAQRLTADPFVDALAHELDGKQGKIAAADVWAILNIAPAQRTQDMNRRLGDAIRKAGWQRATKTGVVRINGKVVSGYVKGPKPWATVTATREPDGRLALEVTQPGATEPDM